MKGEFLPPFGKGEIADVVFSCPPQEYIGDGFNGRNRRAPRYKNTVVAIFPGDEANGIQSVSVTNQQALLKVREAFENGYQRKLSLSESMAYDLQHREGLDSGKCYCFRIRTERDEAGRIKLKLPTRIIEVRYKDGSRNTIELTCDRGWQFSFRIHNASREVEPSLKFDIQLVSQLSSHASVNIDEPWANDIEHTGNPRVTVIDDVNPSLRFRECLPFYSLRATCGKFGDGEAVECEGWVKVEGCGRLDERMFVVRASGRSMEPKIHDGDLCVMRANPQGSRQGKDVLAEHRDMDDPETGGAYSIKRYSSEKSATRDGSWQHERIVLSPLNRDYDPIVIDENAHGDCRIVAELVKVLHPRSSERRS